MQPDETGRSLGREAGWPALHESDQGVAEAPAKGPGDDSVVETGTTVVGLTTAEGVVLAADRRASLGGRFVSNKDVQKVAQVHPTAATANSGAVGHIQKFNDTLQAEARLYDSRRGEQMSLTALSTLAGNVLGSAPLYVEPLLGGVDEDGPQIYELDGGGGVLTDTYAAKGSGMQLAYGVLEREYEEGLDFEAATEVAASAVEAATERDTASGNGLSVALVDEEGVETTVYDEVSEVLS
jgi:proteasome beta subunit